MRSVKTSSGPRISPAPSMLLRALTPPRAFLLPRRSTSLSPQWSWTTPHTRSPTPSVPSKSLSPHFLCPPEASEADFRTISFLPTTSRTTLYIHSFCERIPWGRFSVCMSCVCVYVHATFQNALYSTLFVQGYLGQFLFVCMYVRVQSSRTGSL